MRLTIIALGLLLAVAACADNDWYDDRQQSAAPASATAPTVPPQAGQSGQTSQPQTSQPVPREPPGGTQALSGTTGMGAATGLQLSAAEHGFIMEAAQHGLAEVQLGRLAQQRGASAQVRDFGRTMVQQHTQANQELMTIAQRNGLTPPTALSPAAQAAQSRLQIAQGQDFDRQYIVQQAAAHVAQRAMFQFAADNARNAELRSFAQKILPVVERHIDQLRAMAPVASRTGS